MKDTKTYKRDRASLKLLELEEAIYFIKQNFQRYLAESLRLYRVSAPLFVSNESGMQDNLNGKENPVSFRVPAFGGETYEVVHSLAKWKRYALYRYGVPVGRGIYTDMNALRPDEESLSTGIHSVYVDQWDWEKAISPEDRNLDMLRAVVRKIYGVLLRVEREVSGRYGIESVLPGEIAFLHTEELAEWYPGLSPRERENRACREWGAVFLIGIGGELSDGVVHDGRAPDYDDWSTGTGGGRCGLNGDILVWNPVLGRAFELSSMGIRVDRGALMRQLAIRGCTDRLKYPWHRMLAAGELPESIGGGIGQSRLCMFLLRRLHIGEVQACDWPRDIRSACQSDGIRLL